VSLCNKSQTPLQRRTIQRLGGALILTVLTNFSTPSLPNPLVDLFPGLSQFRVHDGHPSTLVVGLVSAFSVLPVLLAVWVIYHYLKAEPDEFIRALVIRSLLWGFAVTMTGNALAGVYMNFYSRPFPLTVLNADLFFISTGLAFRLLQRSYR
jgi:hypothetical protein